MPSRSSIAQHWFVAIVAISVFCAALALLSEGVVAQPTTTTKDNMDTVDPSFAKLLSLLAIDKSGDGSSHALSSIPSRYWIEIVSGSGSVSLDDAKTRTPIGQARAAELVVLDRIEQDTLEFATNIAPFIALATVESAADALLVVDRQDSGVLTGVADGQNSTFFPKSFERAMRFVANGNSSAVIQASWLPWGVLLWGSDLRGPARSAAWIHLSKDTALQYAAARGSNHDRGYYIAPRLYAQSQATARASEPKAELIIVKSWLDQVIERRRMRLAQADAPEYDLELGLTIQRALLGLAGFTGLRTEANQWMEIQQKSPDIRPLTQQAIENQIFENEIKQRTICNADNRLVLMHGAALLKVLADSLSRREGKIDPSNLGEFRQRFATTLTGAKNSGAAMRLSQINYLCNQTHR